MAITRAVGAKYNGDLDVVEIAALFRADVKAAIKSGALPKGLKLAVKCQKYAGGCSISVRVKAYPGEIHAPSVVRYRMLNWKNPNAEQIPVYARYSDEARAVMAALRAMLDAYRSEVSEWASDYCETNFFGRADWCGELERLKWEAATAKYLTPEEKILAA